jgi:hypothetical protein
MKQSIQLCIKKLDDTKKGLYFAENLLAIRELAFGVLKLNDPALIIQETNWSTLIDGRWDCINPSKRIILDEQNLTISGLDSTDKVSCGYNSCIWFWVSADSGEQQKLSSLSHLGTMELRPRALKSIRGAYGKLAKQARVQKLEGVEISQLWGLEFYKDESDLFYQELTDSVRDIFSQELWCHVPVKTFKEMKPDWFEHYFIKTQLNTAYNFVAPGVYHP